MTLQDVVDGMGLQVTNRDFRVLNYDDKLTIARVVNGHGNTSFNFDNQLDWYVVGIESVSSLKATLHAIFNRNAKVHESMLI